MRYAFSTQFNGQHGERTYETPMAHTTCPVSIRLYPLSSGSRAHTPTRTRSKFQVFLRTCSLPDFILFHFCRRRRQCPDRFFSSFSICFRFSFFSLASMRLGHVCVRAFFFSFLAIDYEIEWDQHSIPNTIWMCFVGRRGKRKRVKLVRSVVVDGRKVCRNWLAISLWQIIYVTTTCMTTRATRKRRCVRCPCVCVCRQLSQGRRIVMEIKVNWVDEVMCSFWVLRKIHASDTVTGPKKTWLWPKNRVRNEQLQAFNGVCVLSRYWDGFPAANIEI